jgi:uncharacterized repeat protein (TIGR01451 family)
VSTRTSLVGRTLVGLAVLAGAAATTACGGPTTLGVDLVLNQSGASQVAPGETVTMTVTVTDTGPAAAGGVTVSLDLPAEFRYSSTVSLSQGTGVRTSPVDPQGNSTRPVWGVWNLNGHGDTVVVEFIATAAGNPGSYPITASASGSSTDTTTSRPVTVTLLSAPELSASVSVTPNQAQPGDQVTYGVTVVNQGTGAASGVSVLVTLPPVFVFAGGVAIGGNATRPSGGDPPQGTELAFFNTFTIPPRSGTSPGQLVIHFVARIDSNAGALGSYPVGLQVLAGSGAEYRVTLAATAPVDVT